MEVGTPQMGRDGRGGTYILKKKNVMEVSIMRRVPSVEARVPLEVSR